MFNKKLRQEIDNYKKDISRHDTDINHMAKEFEKNLKRLRDELLEQKEKFEALTNHLRIGLYPEPNAFKIVKFHGKK